LQHFNFFVALVAIYVNIESFINKIIEDNTMLLIATIRDILRLVIFIV